MLYIYVLLWEMIYQAVLIVNFIGGGYELILDRREISSTLGACHYREMFTLQRLKVHQLYIWDTKTCPLFL